MTNVKICISKEPWCRRNSGLGSRLYPKTRKLFFIAPEARNTLLQVWQRNIRSRDLKMSKSWKAGCRLGKRPVCRLLQLSQVRKIIVILERLFCWPLKSKRHRAPAETKLSSRTSATSFLRPSGNHDGDYLVDFIWLNPMVPPRFSGVGSFFGSHLV